MTRTVRGSLCRPSIRTSSHHAIAMTIDQCAHRVLLLIARLSAGRGVPRSRPERRTFAGGSDVRAVPSELLRVAASVQRAKSGCLEVSNAVSSVLCNRSGGFKRFLRFFFFNCVGVNQVARQSSLFTWVAFRGWRRETLTSSAAYTHHTCSHCRAMLPLRFSRSW